MCGIFAVTGNINDATNRVVEGLKKLEYRGYDSWGLAWKSAEKIIVQKSVGKVTDVVKNFPKSHKAMGHTRWATHGGVTKVNAHPHQYGEITLIHNGIFENFQEYKKALEKKGASFTSETDSEVMAVLIQQYLDEGFDMWQTLQKITEIIQGRFAIVVMHEKMPGIWAVRKGSPLIIGRSDEAIFIASDIPAFLKYTNTVNYLDDEEAVYIKTPNPSPRSRDTVSGALSPDVHIENKKENFVEFRNVKTGEIVKKRNIAVPWKEEEAEKGEFAHFMIKEIVEQKDSIARSINHDDALLKKFTGILRSCDGAYLIGCGTAHKMCMTAEYFFAHISGRKINVVPASEMSRFERFVHKNTAIIAVSQSGETADIMAVLEQAKKKSAKILSLTNVESSSVARISDVHVPINVGPEKAVASTKASTAQMALLFLLAYADAENINVGRQILRSTSAAINDLINPRYEELIKKIAQKISTNNHLFIIGKNELYPIALESAIKIQEVSYIHAQGFAAGELKHGPIALIEAGSPCIVLGDDPETVSNATELKSRGAHIIGIAPNRAEIFDDFLRVPDCDGAQAIASLIPVQILAYHLAVAKNLDPDRPRNLAKSVTVK